MRSFLTGVFLALCCFPAIQAQVLVERHQRIRRAVDNADLNTALIELRTMHGSDPALFSANNYDYLLGRIAEHQGDRASSASNYGAVVLRNSPLSQYALWHLAQLARGTGDLVLERERLRQLIVAAPNSLMRDAAVMRLGRSFFESLDFPSAISALQSLITSSNVTTAREAATLVAQAYLRAGQPAEAQTLFVKLLMSMPDASRPDDYALAAVRALDSLESHQSQPLAEAEHLLRASVYQFNRDFDAARLHYLAVIQINPQSGTVPNALFQIGRGLNQQQRFDEALNYFQRVVDKFPASSSTRDSLTAIAATFGRLKRTDDAVQAYRQLLAQYPDVPNPERFYLNIIDSLHEAGRYQEAVEWVQETRKHFKNGLGSALALFAQARIHMAQGSWPSVITDTEELTRFSELGGNLVPGGTTTSEVMFLRAYALEQLGNLSAAVEGYLAIPEGRNEYYSKIATARLQVLAGNAKTRTLIESRVASALSDARTALDRGQADRARGVAQTGLRLTTEANTRNQFLQILTRVYETLPAYKLPAFRAILLGRRDPSSNTSEPKETEPTHLILANELFFLGLYDEAVPEFAKDRATAGSIHEEGPINGGGSHKLSSSLSDVDYTLALYSLQGGLANRAIRFAEQVWKSVPADYVLEVAPGQLVELLYPAPYRESLLTNSTAKNVDPRFVLSIARQESRFQPDAKSVAAARGLMQFIPGTAREVASQLGRPEPEQEDLYNPDVAITFGAEYLSSLFKKFVGQPEAVAASYNGGAENVARWIARSRSNDPLRYVPEIGFAQTKDYVFKVMINFWIYQQVYDSRLQVQSAGQK